MLKYEFTNETQKIEDYLGKFHTLHRIKALKDFGDVKKGDLGGWLEKESNLSQEGDCWVYNDAQVFGDARVYGNARVCDNSVVCGNTEVLEITLRGELIILCICLMYLVQGQIYTLCGYILDLMNGFLGF